ncbi:uncharacterized protein LOC112516375 [Cynara cardunculus var. scolymus]|uniref:uncharacterized protein LOC112516375 n=1 Tax=Cynara cardunculus var. scolymus TaxID=59895 RepID=UPI000D62D012|nr:uncharacterized protein LOC112516375 [Cynara cardunculus var. scolymus]
MTAEDFSTSVDMGLRLSKRIYYGKDERNSMSAPKPVLMTKSSSLRSSTSSSRLPPDQHHATAPMVYAVITEPDVVDNPDIRSYQPHVFGRCNPPALIPLHMHGITMNVDCYLGTAFVTVSGSWRMHCVTASACCDCRIAIPMGEQGSILEVEAETTKRSYFTKFISPGDDQKDSDRVTKAKDGFMMKRNTYTLKIPQVEGGSLIHVKVRWSQKLQYQNDEFCLNVPFTFPRYVLPFEKKIPVTEKVLVNVDSATGTVITCTIASHPLKVFRKEVVFLLDISGSMRDVPLEKSKYAIEASLSRLNEGDSFNIIAFNEGIQSFSSSLELATEEAITNATEWMWKKLYAGGGTNLICPLKQAIDMVGQTGELIPLIFLITDGTVEDERDICNMMKCYLVDGAMNSPRICTFGIGSYCNHYFLQMLANIGRGYYDAAYEVDSISDRMERLFDNAFSPIVANITLDALENLKSYELYPSRIPDLSSGSPLIVSGRYHGKFPEIVKVRGFLADLSTCEIDLKVRKSTNINLDRISAKREVDILTAQAWLNQDTHLKEKVAEMSLQRGVPSEYTRMILVQSDKVKPTLGSLLVEEKCSKKMNQKMILLRSVCVGFGNLKATATNLPPGIEDVKLNDAAKMVMKAASSCWGMFSDWYCWRCLLQAWSRVKNEQCAIAVAQLCTALACLESLDFCCELCDSCIDLCQ